MIYSLKTADFIKHTSINYIKIENRYLNVSKLVLQAFKGEPYRPGQIAYNDGQPFNLYVHNIKYKALFERTQKNEVNKADLMTAIRCYFAVNENYKTKDYLQTRQYLRIMTNDRAFFDLKSEHEHVEIFRTFIKGYDNSIIKTAKIHKMSVLNCAVIVNGFINLLVSDIMTDLKSGILSIKQFEPPRKRKPTEKQLLKEWETEMNKIKNSPKA
jgi:hypothetical protein